MKVQLAFDTETESLEDLKKLEKWVQELIEKRGGKFSEPKTEIRNEPVIQQKEQIREMPKPQPSNTTKTSGGSSVVPYEDMSALLEKIASGK